DPDQPRGLHEKITAWSLYALLGRILFSLFPAMTNDTILQLELPGIKKLKSGKVREIFDLDDRFLFVATDRISAFDVVMPNGIPRKGEVLTQVSYFWFDQTK